MLRSIASYAPADLISHFLQERPFSHRKLTCHTSLAMDRNHSSFAITSDEHTKKDLSPLRSSLRTQDAMPELRRFEFGELPPELRLRIYRILLVDYNSVRKFDNLHGTQVSEKRNGVGSGNSSDDQTDTQSDDSSDEDDDDDDSQDESTIAWLRIHPQPIFPQHIYRRFSLYPGILRTNKLIHKEASAVLYGENPFSWCASALLRMPVWHLADPSRTFVPQHYSCLITKMHLFVDLRISKRVMSIIPYGFCIIELNLKDFSSSFARNNLKVLKVDIRHPRFWLERTVTGAVLEKRKSDLQRCLAPLRMIRAGRVSFSCNGARLI